MSLASYFQNDENMNPATMTSTTRPTSFGSSGEDSTHTDDGSVRSTRALRVFGELVSEVENSLCYSPSPLNDSKKESKLVNNNAKSSHKKNRILAYSSTKSPFQKLNTLSNITNIMQDTKRTLPFGSITFTPEKSLMMTESPKKKQLGFQTTARNKIPLSIETDLNDSISQPKIILKDTAKTDQDPDKTKDKILCMSECEGYEEKNSTPKAQSKKPEA